MHTHVCLPYIDKSKLAGLLIIPLQKKLLTKIIREELDKFYIKIALSCTIYAAQGGKCSKLCTFINLK